MVVIKTKNHFLPSVLSHGSKSSRSFCASSSRTSSTVRLCTLLLLTCTIILWYLQVVITFILTHHEAGLESNIRSAANAGRNARKSMPRQFVTVVMPSVVNPPGRTARLTAITDTWGPKANAIFVVHDLQQYTSSIRAASTATSANSLFYPKPLLIPSNISESMGLDRLLYVLNQLLVQHHNFQYAFFVNDHTFVIPEHLCYFLQSMEQKQHQQQPWQHHNYNEDTNDFFLYAGHAMKESGQEYMFNSGAAGYVLTRSTIRQLIDTIVYQRHTCYSNIPQNKLAWYQGNPGLIIAKCLHEAHGVDAIDTRDNPGSILRRHVFHAFGLVRMVTGKVDEWYKNKHRLLQFTTTTTNTSGIHQQQQQQYNTGMSNHTFMEEQLKYLLPFGRNCCSTYSTTFHYVNPEETRALYELRQWIQTHKNDQSVIPYSLLERNILGTMVRQKWPSSEDSLGFYGM